MHSLWKGWSHFPLATTIVGSDPSVGGSEYNVFLHSAHVWEFMTGFIFSPVLQYRVQYRSEKYRIRKNLQPWSSGPGGIMNCESLQTCKKLQGCSPARMPSITNIGGSLTSAIVLTLIAWGVRFFRAAAQRNQGSASQNQGSQKQLGKFHASLTPASLRMLVRCLFCCLLNAF